MYYCVHIAAVKLHSMARPFVIISYSLTDYIWVTLFICELLSMLFVCRRPESLIYMLYIIFMSKLPSVNYDC